MTDTVTIKFEDDMPASAVDVIGPDLAVLRRLMLAAGKEEQVEVAQRPCFLMLHMADGSSIAMPDEGSGHWHLSSAKIRASTGKPIQIKAPENATKSGCGPVIAGDLPLPAGMILLDHLGQSIAGRTTPVNRWANWPLDDASAGTAAPLLLRMEQLPFLRCEVRLPGSAIEVWARLNDASNKFEVRVTTSSQVADTIASYVQHGNLYSAQTMAAWFDNAAALQSEPYALCVGGYLLLRLRQQVHIGDWIDALVAATPLISDPWVIRAWYRIHTGQAGHDALIKGDLLEASRRGLPVFSEGVRLLLDGLQMMGTDGSAARNTLLAKAGCIIWGAPLTTSVHSSAGDDPLPAGTPSIDVAFGPPASG